MPDKKPPHGIGILMIHAMPLKKKKRKAGGNVEGAEARQHLGKRARGGGIHIKPSHAGRLHEDLGVPSGEKIPAAKLDKALHSADPAERKRAVFAKNAKSWSR